MHRPESRRASRVTWSPISLLLIALMAIGSVIMWLGVPVGLIYLASQHRRVVEAEHGPVSC